MRSNQYHLLRFIPATRAWEMPPGLEALAQQLVRSGKLRINADFERNFVRLGTSDTDKTFTARELNDAQLRPRTFAELARHVPPATGQQGVQELHTRLLGELKKARGVSAEKEINVARVLVQAAHPAVIRLLLMSGSEIYVSYAHNVGDLMPVHQWSSSSGTASGLQSTAEEGTAVYVSCGGDPFFEGEHRTYVTDGFDALARMVVIAGQELGHFSDLRRSTKNPHSIMGRFSTDQHASQLRAHPRARDGRLSDIARVEMLTHYYTQAGLPRLRRAEKGVAFYHTRWRYTPPWCWYQLRRFVAWTLFTTRCRVQKTQLHFRTYPAMRHGEALELWLADMAFNLAPDADVYRDADPLVEEAIACIEALARVPQQVHKWGHVAVQFSWPQLYEVYYGTVIPAAMALAGVGNSNDSLKLFQLVIVKLRQVFSVRPAYWPATHKNAKTAK